MEKSQSGLAYSGQNVYCKQNKVTEKKKNFFKKILNRFKYFEKYKNKK